MSGGVVIKDEVLSKKPSTMLEKIEESLERLNAEDGGYY